MYIIWDLEMTTTCLANIHFSLDEFEEGFQKYRSAQRKSVRARLLSRPTDDRDLRGLMDIFKAANHRLTKLQRHVSTSPIS